MKTIKQFGVVLALTLTTILTSCSSSDGGGGGNAASGTMKAKVDGTSLSSSAPFTTGTKINAGGSTTLTLQGTNSAGKGYQFVVNGFTGVGTYEIGGSSSIFVVGTYIESNVSNPSDSQTWTAPYDETVAGEISFSSVTDTKVVGTFHFTGKNTDDSSVKEITDGSFNVNVTSF